MAPHKKGAPMACGLKVEPVRLCFLRLAYRYALVQFPDVCLTPHTSQIRQQSDSEKRRESQAKELAKPAARGGTGWARD